MSDRSRCPRCLGAWTQEELEKLGRVIASIK